MCIFVTPSLPVPEKEMATRSSILAWEVPWKEEPGGLQPMGCKELDTTWQRKSSSFIHSSIDEHLGCVHILAAVNIHVHISFQITVFIFFG